MNWGNVAEWVVISSTAAGTVVAWLKSKNAALKAHEAELRAAEADERANRAIGIAEAALAQLETMNKANADRAVLEDAERGAAAKAQWFIDLVGQQQLPRASMYEPKISVSSQFPVRTEHDRIGLLKAAERAGVRLNPPDPKVGGACILSIPNPLYRPR